MFVITENITKRPVLLNSAGESLLLISREVCCIKKIVFLFGKGIFWLTSSIRTTVTGLHVLQHALSINSNPFHIVSTVTHNCLRYLQMCILYVINYHYTQIYILASTLQITVQTASLAVMYNICTSFTYSTNTVRLNVLLFGRVRKVTKTGY
jgi:hypothetical protein